MALIDYKCPNCSGAINFDTGIQKMKCPYCDAEFEMEALQGYDEILKGDTKDEMNWNMPQGEWGDGERAGLSVYTCNSCGGEIVGDDTLGATDCPFCGNKVVISGAWEKGLRPDLVIPFKLNKKQAKEKFSEYLTGKILLPKVFKAENHIDEIKGIYVPFWLFDANTDGRMRFKAHKLRTWSDSEYNYTETSYFSVIREGGLRIKGIPADASAKMDDILMQSLEPYDLKDAVDFQTAYLAGFLADKYDVNSDEQIEVANKRIRESINSALSSTVEGYSSFVTEQESINVDNETTKYALYPVWLLTTKWQGQVYLFAMNGQTGKFVGDLPVDKGMRAKIFAGITVAASVAVFLLTGLFL